MIKSKYFLRLIVFIFAVTFILSGASCAENSAEKTEVQQKSVESQEESGVKLDPNVNIDIGRSSGSVQADVEAIVSSELEVASDDQSAVVSKDAEDRALVTSDSEAFGGVGALGSEYQYE